VSIWQDKDGRYHVGIMRGGKRIHRKLPQGATKSDAKDLDAALRESLGRRPAPSIPQDPPMTAVLGLYLEHAKTLRSPDTAIHHANRLGPWAEEFRASQARAFAAKVIADMREAYAPATVNRSLAAAKKALSLAWERGLTHENYGLHIKAIPARNMRDMTLTMKQVKALADASSDQVAAAIWIAIFTGCRRGEILSLTKDDIGANEIRLRAGNTKTFKARTVPIIDPVRRWLKYVPLQINAEGLKTGFRRARERAEMPWITFHDLRRSCATLMIEAGEDIYAVSRMLGHSSVAVTQARYAKMADEQVREAMSRTFGGRK
jgi:integrase